MRKICWLLPLIFSINAHSLNDFIPIDIEGNYEASGIDVKVNTVANLAMLEIGNGSSNVVKCEGVFHSGPEPDVLRKALLNPGAEKMLSAKFHRNVIRLKISVNCEKQS